jgi:LuxR family maltose regulon positive regulatory protein
MPPHLHAGLVLRADLMSRLDEGATRKLTAVVAPTGFGKTTLAGMWAESRKPPLGWVTLDENDNDPVRFWTYLAAAIRGIDRSLGKTSLSMLSSPQPPVIQQALTALINDLAGFSTSCVLALENYSAITSPEINTALAFLIQNLPAALHLVLIARREPDLPLAILRARDELTEIGTAALRFTREETGAFLQQALNADLPSPLVDRLYQKTEGWPAGLRLAVQSLQTEGPGRDALVQAFSGSDRRVADYLIQEVFHNQSAQTQEFLLKTCFLDRLTGSLCDAVTGATTSADELEELLRQNLFLIQLENRSGRSWYRYIPLFAESIQSLARRKLGEQSLKEQSGKASTWYEAHGFAEDAIETALAADLFDRTMGLIEKYIEIHDLAEMRTLGRWLERIPPSEIFANPVICFTYAQVLLYSSPDRFAPSTALRLEPLLGAAEKAWTTAGDSPRLGELHSFRGIVSWWTGNLQQGFQYAHQSLAELPDHDVYWKGNSLLLLSHEALNAGRILEAQDSALEARALLGAVQNVYGVLAATQLLSEVFYWQGELEQCQLLNEQILTEAVGDESVLDDQGIASLGLADVAYEQNDLVNAEQLAGKALELGNARGNEALQVLAAIRLAWIWAAQNDLHHAEEDLNRIRAKIRKPKLLRQIQEAQMRFSLLAGDLEAAAGWLSVISSDTPDVLPVQKENEAFTLARLRIAEGQPADALAALGTWRKDAAAHGRLRSQVSALCLEGIACQADSNPTHAMTALVEGLKLGQKHGLQRIFLDEGDRMAALLQACLPSLNRPLGAFAALLLRSFQPGLDSQRVTVIEPLSPQEMRVLHLLVGGLSNREIADELIVSTNTIKTQLKSIYRKLNVNSREEARQVSREMKRV